MPSVFAAHPGGSAAILIGPEGGFSENERRILDRRENCLKVSLVRAYCRPILRNSRADMLQSVYGDWPGIT